MKKLVVILVSALVVSCGNKSQKDDFVYVSFDYVTNIVNDSDVKEVISEVEYGYFDAAPFFSFSEKAAGEVVINGERFWEKRYSVKVNNQEAMEIKFYTKGSLFLDGKFFRCEDVNFLNLSKDDKGYYKYRTYIGVVSIGNKVKIIPVEMRCYDLNEEEKEMAMYRDFTREGTYGAYKIPHKYTLKRDEKFEVVTVKYKNEKTKTFAQ